MNMKCAIDYFADGEDYSTTSGILNLTPGGREVCTSSIPIIDDDTKEPDESFGVDFFSGLIRFSSTITIIDNDQGDKLRKL